MTDKQTDRFLGLLAALLFGWLVFVVAAASLLASVLAGGC